MSQCLIITSPLHKTYCELTAAVTKLEVKCIQLQCSPQEKQQLDSLHRDSKQAEAAYLRELALQKPRPDLFWSDAGSKQTEAAVAVQPGPLRYIDLEGFHPGSPVFNIVNAALLGVVFVLLLYGFKAVMTWLYPDEKKPDQH